MIYQISGIKENKRGALHLRRRIVEFLGNNKDLWRTDPDTTMTYNIDASQSTDHSKKKKR